MVVESSDEINLKDDVVFIIFPTQTNLREIFILLIHKKSFMYEIMTNFESFTAVSRIFILLFLYEVMYLDSFH